MRLTYFATAIVASASLTYAMDLDTFQQAQPENWLSQTQVDSLAEAQAYLMSFADADSNAYADAVSHTKASQCPTDGSPGTRDFEGLCPNCGSCPKCGGIGNESLNCYDGRGGFFEQTLMWVVNMWKLGEPIYQAYRPKLCEECTMDPWIVMRRLKQIMDCKINCQPPYLFKPIKSGPPRPEMAIGQNYDFDRKLPYSPDNIKKKEQTHEAEVQDAHDSIAAGVGKVDPEFIAVINKANDAVVARVRAQRDKNMKDPTAPHINEIASELIDLDPKVSKQDLQAFADAKQKEEELGVQLKEAEKKKAETEKIDEDATKLVTVPVTGGTSIAQSFSDSTGAYY